MGKGKERLKKMEMEGKYLQNFGRTCFLSLPPKNFILASLLLSSPLPIKERTHSHKQ